MSMHGRHVVITGAAGALGRAVLESVRAAGAICHVPVRSDAEAATVRAIAPEVHIAPAVDLTDEASVTSFYASLPALWASVHVAGGYKGAALAETSAADFRAQLEINLVSAFLCSREAVRSIRAGVAGEGGRIVNVVSRAALVPGAGAAAYAASKAGLVSLTQSLAEELKGERILVNAVAPSIMDTPANRAAMPDADFAAWPKTAEVAAAIAWLVSVEASLTSGAVVPVYGRS